MNTVASPNAACGLGARPFVGVDNVAEPLHPAYPSAPPARGGLDHAAGSRVARLARGHRRPPSTGPPLQGDHGNAGFLGQPLRADLVAETAHDVCRRTDEDDAQPVAQLGELGVLGDEAPTDPRRVGPAATRACFKRAVVQVAALSPTVAGR